LVLCETPANIIEREIRRPEHGNFDSIESMALDFGK